MVEMTVCMTGVRYYQGHEITRWSDLSPLDNKDRKCLPS